MCSAFLGGAVSGTEPGVLSVIAVALHVPFLLTLPLS